MRKPTNQQIMNALAVIENADDADVLTLTTAAIHAAWKWRVLIEVAENVQDQDSEAFDAVHSAFEALQ